MAKKRILCFGDSNTWGYNPKNLQRYDDEVRWTGVLQATLGDEYTVIEEGQNGRTIALDDWTDGLKNGLKYAKACIESQSPLELMIVMLGTNDLKSKYKLKPYDIGREMDYFLQQIIAHNQYMLRNQDMRILVMSPPHMSDGLKTTWIGEEYNPEEAIEYSKGLAKEFRRYARLYKCSFLDTASLVETSPYDGCHMAPDMHEILGKAVADKVKEILG